MKKFKFGCHNFLNSQPILIPLIEKKVVDLEITQGSPAHLAMLLKQGKLDLSFIPSIEYAKNSNYLLVNDISISSIGSVDTVLLIGKTEMKNIKSVAVDNRSLSSVVLLKILFQEKFGRLPTFSNAEPDDKKMLSSHDAAMIIGDKSFSVEKSGKAVYDLSHEWFQLTQKPFVHAVLCVRKESQVDASVIQKILNSRDEGLLSIKLISKQASQSAEISEEKCMDYLLNKIVYTFGEKEHEGLKEFFSLARKHGFIDEEPELCWFNQQV